MLQLGLIRLLRRVRVSAGLLDHAQYPIYLWPYLPYCSLISYDSYMREAI